MHNGHELNAWMSINCSDQTSSDVDHGEVEVILRRRLTAKNAATDEAKLAREYGVGKAAEATGRCFQNKT
jgi:hypothetical protein